ncbi:hypothetical protein M885DRAFT_125048 [Pelagophyceae sp. CCMP2097]|nr:hypothetical protein M885DRAFT_125048 [Pelagophyceae sp. CCMP2097]
MPSARELSCFRRELLLPSQTDLLIKLKWSGKGATLCDLDLSCQLFDVQGRCLEIVDFENTVSNDRAASHGGDAVHEAGGGPTEQVFVDTRRFASQVHAVAVCATNFSSTFDNVGHVEFTVDHLTFVESSQPVDGVGKPWHERTLINVHPLWEATVHASAADRARFYALRPSVPFGDRASAGSDADDERNSKRIMKRRRSRRLRRDPHLVDSTANLCVLFKLARDASANGLVPLWRLDGGLEQSTAGTRGEMIAAAQQSMSDIFPWLRAAKKRLFSGVAQVCAALSSGALPDMKRAFLAEKGGPELARFSQILFRQLVATHARRNELLRPREAAHVVALLHELFRQIDIDGNGRVDWEEFTNHAVSAGMSAAGADDDDVQRPPGSAARGAADESTVRYVLDAAHAVKRPPGEAQSTKHAPVHLLLLVPELGRLLVVERDSAALSAYDTAGTYEHAHSFAGAKEASIHDLCYIPERSTLVAALSDHAIHLLTEQLTSAGRHRAYATAGVIVTAALHRRLVWSSTADRLFSVDTASRLYAWDIETAAKTQRPAGAPLVPHSDILMDLIFIKEKGLLATCGLDRAVRLWGIENLRPRGTLAGHTRGVRALAYAQSLLVSGGFDNVAIVWDITSHERACTLAGHRAAICSIELVAPSRDAVTVFTLDDSAECRVWHLARDASGATLHETIRLPGQDPQGPTRALCLPGNAKFSVDDFPDMFVGGARLHHLVPVKATREFAPPACCAYNSTSWHFVAAVGDRVHAWDARSGDYVQRFVAAAPASARAADVSAMCFDEPRQRRLFVGTDVGDLVVLNYVTGAVLFHARPHAAEVAGIAFCADTKCLISVGLDGLLHVHLDSSSALELLRSAENIHRGAAVTCFAYSGPAALILTGDADGEVCVWCFQSLHQFAVIKLGAAAAALRVLDPLMIMLTADAHGELLVWSLAQQFVRGRGRVATLQAGPAGERDFAAARVVLRRAAGDRLGHLRPRLPRAHRGERAGEVGQSRSPQAQGLAVVLAAVRRRGVGRRGGRRLGRGVFVGPRVVERGGVVRGVGGVAVVRRRLRGVRERPRLWVGL